MSESGGGRTEGKINGAAAMAKKTERQMGGGEPTRKREGGEIVWREDTGVKVVEKNGLQR